jgi:hypothetical protein
MARVILAPLLLIVFQFRASHETEKTFTKHVLQLDKRPESGHAAALQDGGNPHILAQLSLAHPQA